MRKVDSYCFGHILAYVFFVFLVDVSLDLCVLIKICITLLCVKNVLVSS